MAMYQPLDRKFKVDSVSPPNQEPFANTKQTLSRTRMLIGVRAALITTIIAVSVAIVGCQSVGGGSPSSTATVVAQGKQIFRFDTFGDETKWTDKLRLHEVVRKAVDPTTALSVGLKVDAEALPPAVVTGIKNGSISLKSPRYHGGIADAECGCRS